MKKLNILALSYRDKKNPESGGAEIYLDEIFKRMVSKGHNITLLCSKFKNSKENEKVNGINVIRKSNKYFFNIYAMLYYFLKLRRQKYDLIIEDMNKIAFFTPLYVKRPILAVYSHVNGKTLFKEVFFPLSLVLYLIERYLTPLFYRNTKFCVVSYSTFSELVNMGLGEDNISVIHNGLNHRLYKPNFKLKNKYPFILYIGKIKKYKNIEALIKAMKIVIQNFPNSRLSIVGTGNNFKKIKKMVEQYNLHENVKFHGYVKDIEKVKLLQRATVLVNPSQKEGWGLNVIEANACGTPVIASDVPGLRDSVIDGETGILVPYDDETALANSIIGLIGENKLRKKIEDNAVSNSMKYDWEKTYISFILCISNILKNSNY